MNVAEKKTVIVVSSSEGCPEGFVVSPSASSAEPSKAQPNGGVGLEAWADPPLPTPRVDLPH
jgi:hypothetical protein